MEQASKKTDARERSNSLSDNAVDPLVVAMETKAQFVRRIIEEAETEMDTVHEDKLKNYGT